MLFNSCEFLIFFPIVTTLYFALPQAHRWLLLLIASCVFYMAFIPAYILILIITIVIDYFAGMWIEDSGGDRRRVWLIVSIVSTCLVLFVFKYFNFFNTNAASLAAWLGWNYPITAIRIILPIGLSFHTFQSLSYVIEVYRGRQKAERNFGHYALYVMYYPQLVAGPIERPQNLLHQLREEHHFDYVRVVSGLQRMAWGMFQKVVIADRLALFVDKVYNGPEGYLGVSIIIATVFFAFQICCDFAGYSDIALGAAEVMGVRLMENFNRPYFSKSIGEFWKRWHISLSTWFRDYVYIPMGGNRATAERRQINIFITFLVSGLWHGANWTFVVWGALHGTYMLVSHLTRGLRADFIDAVGLRRTPIAHAYVQRAIVFVLVCFAWIFFRAKNVTEAFYLVAHSLSGLTALPALLSDDAFVYKYVYLGFPGREFCIAIGCIALLFFIHVIQRKRSVRQLIAAQPLGVRWAVYAVGAVALLNLGIVNEIPFIYFQF
jgi:D-alanyl-lipoteichoic acid acyltransferase DltB (MBOAT superfamily)